MSQIEAISLIEASKQALEALENTYALRDDVIAAKASLRQAIAEAEPSRSDIKQEPVAWRYNIDEQAIYVSGVCAFVAVDALHNEHSRELNGLAGNIVNAMNHPQPKREPLTDEQTQKVLECAKRLVEHADFKLGGILSADSKAKDIPSNAVSSVKARHLASLRDALKLVE